jgi:DNA-binding protein H-NS
VKRRVSEGAETLETAKGFSIPRASIADNILDLLLRGEYLPRLYERLAMARTASLKLIEAKIRDLQEKAEEIKHREKPGMKQLKSVISRYRLTLDDAKLAFNGRGNGSVSALRGRKVRPKYRNPTNKSETWAGRGLKPKWLTAQLRKGKKLEDFAISA